MPYDAYYCNALLRWLKACLEVVVKIKPSWQPLTSWTFSSFLSSDWPIVYNHKSANKSLLAFLILYYSLVTPIAIKGLPDSFLLDGPEHCTESTEAIDPLLSLLLWIQTPKKFMYMGHGKWGGTQKKDVSYIFFKYLRHFTFSSRVSILQIWSSMAHWISTSHKPSS